ncbi:MAG: glycine oxidase ThiO [Armatimonadota bacterium]
MSSPEVLVVGGGVIGSAAAYFLARAGVSVRLLERDGLASHASGAAAGMLAPICESESDSPFFRLALRSLGLFPELAPRLRELSGIDPQYVPSGAVRAALTEPEAEALRERSRRLGRFGVEWLDARAAREREPLLSPRTVGALWSPAEANVYSPQLGRAYAGAAAALGAEIRTGVAATGLLRRGGRVLGVRTTDGEMEAGQVVLCAGAWTRFCAGWLDLDLPVRPVRGQILALDAPTPAPRSIVWGEGAYLVPKLNGALVVGATEEDAGFDCRTTAAGVERLLSAARELLPALSQCSFRHAWAGLRPDTPDHLPVIGPIPGVEGVVVAAGHFRNGVLLSPVTGEAVAECVRSGTLPADVAPFRPDRLLRP